jgi:capsular polysaccharide biosynthesis protein
LDQTINIGRFWSIIKKRLLFIISLGFIITGISWGIATYYLTPIYEASRQIVVNNTDNQVNDYNSVMTNFQYANTYSDIIYSDVVLEKVIQDLKLNRTYQDLAKQIEVTSKNESQVITIIVDDPDYELAVDIVNKIATVFEKQVMEIMKIDNVELFPPSVVKPNPEPIQPKPVLFAVVGFIAGIVIGLSTSFFLEAFSNTVTTEQEIEELLRIPVIGAVSKVRPKDMKSSAANIKETLRVSHSKGLGG